jgi:hypothetical protein
VEATIAGHTYRVEPDHVRRVAGELDPEPVDVFFATIDGRRFPPKQIVEALTGLDRADFNSHQARALLVRLGFPVDRRRAISTLPPSGDEPRGGAEARLLGEHVGRWVAQNGLEILYQSDSPEDVARWLRAHGLVARVWRVPNTASEVGSSVSSA